MVWIKSQRQIWMANVNGYKGEWNQWIETFVFIGISSSDSVNEIISMLPGATYS